VSLRSAAIAGLAAWVLAGCGEAGTSGGPGAAKLERLIQVETARSLLTDTT